MSFNSTIDKQTTDQTVTSSTASYDSDVEILDYTGEQQGPQPEALELPKIKYDSPFDEDIKYAEEIKANEVKKEELDEEKEADKEPEDLSLEHRENRGTAAEEFDSVAEENDDDNDGPTSGNRKKHYSCDYCPSEYSLYGSWYQHMWRNHRSELVQKRKRKSNKDTSVSRKSTLKDNKVAHGIQKETSYGTNFPCDHCDYSYRNYTSWYQHVRVHHNGNGLCSEKERTEQLKDNKDNSDSSDDSDDEEPTGRRKVNSGNVHQFSCDHCSMSFKSESWMNRHMGSEHPEMDRERIQKFDEYFECPYCARLYEKYNSILAHLNSQHPDKTRPILEKLRKTGENVSTPRTVKPSQNHNKKESVKSSEPSLKCEKCPRTFVNIDFLNKHKVIHVKPVEEVSSVIFCEGCGQVFKAALNLGIHKRTKCGASLQESSGTLENKSTTLDNSQNGETFFTPPAENKFNIIPQRTVEYARTQQENVVTPHSSNIVPTVKEELIEITPVGVPFVDSSRSARTSSLAIWKRLESNGDNERSSQKRPRTSTKCSDSDDDCMILPSIPKKNRKTEQDANTSFLSDFTTVSRLNSINSSQSFPVDPIEKSRLPLSAAIFTRSAQFSKELMII